MSEEGAPALKPFPTTPGGWPVVLADVPWRFASNSVEKPGRNPMRHYHCMSMARIGALPVADIVAKDAILFFWITSPMLVIGAHIPIMKAWGFKPTAMGFVWVKTKSGLKGNDWRYGDSFEKHLHFGSGFTTRKNCEFLLIGKRGRSLRRSASVREVLIAPVQEHSRKPSEAHARIEQYAEGPYLELFGRQSRPGWTVWGDQAALFDEAA